MSLEVLFTFLFATLSIKGTQSCFTSSETQTIYVKKGTAYYGECSCVTPGYNVGHLKWVDSHNQEIDVLRPGTDQKAYMERQMDSISLHIPNVTKSKSGLYRCVTNFEGTEYSQSYYVLAYEPITINPPEEQYIVLGNRSLVKCKVHAEDESKVMTSWHRVVGDKLTLISNNNKYEIAEEGLYISDVVDEDKGMYSCSAIDKETYDEVDKDINVKIITMPVIKELKIIPQTTVIAGETLVMECIADGIPHPEYIWRKTDVNIMDTNPRWKQEVNAIMIDPVLPEDQGKYECIAQSMAGVDSKSIDISVYFAPNITSFPNVLAVEGSTVELVCDAVGRPAPNVSIIYIGQNENDIVQDRDVDENDVMDNLSFIKNIDKSHDGIYVCNASNEVNYTLEEMKLTVQYKPYFDAAEEIVWAWNGQVVNLNCSPDSNPRANVQWRFLTDNSALAIEINKIIHEATKLNEYLITVNVSEATRALYGIYECNATNHLGNAMKYIHFREGHIPPPIRNATVLTIQATSVLFHIERPDSFEGPPILGYTAEYDQSEDYNVTDIHTNRTWSTDRPFVLENLKADTSYFIRFAPINRVGIGAWSEYYEFETLQPSVPNQPSWNLSMEEYLDEININDTNQAITWTAPEDNGAPVDFYTVKYCPIYAEIPCKEHKLKSNDKLQLDLNLLDWNTTYLVELIAHNYIGNSIAVNITITMPEKLIKPTPVLSAGALIGISVVVVVLCLTILDLLLFLWKKQGMIAICCLRKKKSKAVANLKTRDKKGLLKENQEDSERPDNRHKEYEYNKTTGVITGKHSAV